LKAENKKSLEEILRSPQGLHRGTFRKLLLMLPSRRLKVRLFGLLGYGTKQLSKKYSLPLG
jgi:hypothetical protein